MQSRDLRDILLLTVRSGPNQWRDSQTPRQILEYWCELNNLSKPQYLGNTQLVLDGKVYNLQEYGKLDSLQILESVQQVVSCQAYLCRE